MNSSPLAQLQEVLPLWYNGIHYWILELNGLYSDKQDGA